jgi:hypothetical protein
MPLKKGELITVNWGEFDNFEAKLIHSLILMFYKWNIRGQFDKFDNEFDSYFVVKIILFTKE